MLIAVVWMQLRARSRAARAYLLCIVALYTAASIYIVPASVGRVLVMGYRPLDRRDVPDGRTAIVLLGSGSYTAEDWRGNRLTVLDRLSTSRVLEAFNASRLIEATWIISSGGLVRPSPHKEPSGETMRRMLIQLGVPASRVLVETKSRNTYDEAVIVGEMLRTLDVQHIVLVTSDIHMRRSVGAFRAVGVPVIPAIARNPSVPEDWVERFLPSDLGLRESSLVAHEILGLVYYGARGRFRFH